MAVTPTGQRPSIAAEALLRALADHGADYFLCNTGTDFPPIVEAFSRAGKTNAKVPKPILVPHENLAVAMAHGVYLMNGHPQAVMVHTTAGTANTLNNLINLSRDRVPLILAAGRTPITEKGSFGSRNRPIQWGQEMFDQAGMLREMVKWDYELRVPAQTGDVVARAVEVAMAHPRGPVYLMLPREPLAAALPEPIGPVKPRPQAAEAHPDPAAIATLAEWIAAAERPLIVTAALPANAVPALGALAERCAIPVVTHNPRTVCRPSSHPMHFGVEPGALLTDAGDRQPLMVAPALLFDIRFPCRSRHRFAVRVGVLSFGPMVSPARRPFSVAAGPRLRLSLRQRPAVGEGGAGAQVQPAFRAEVYRSARSPGWLGHRCSRNPGCGPAPSAQQHRLGRRRFSAIGSVQGPVYRPTGLTRPRSRCVLGKSPETGPCRDRLRRSKAGSLSIGRNPGGSLSATGILSPNGKVCLGRRP